MLCALASVPKHDSPRTRVKDRMVRLELAALRGYQKFPGPVVCVILDGIGLGRGDAADGVHLARTPELDRLMEGPLVTRLKAHGTAVGMPSDSDMGNSEVGHNTIGAGRVFDQGAKLVKLAIRSGEVFESPVWRDLMSRAHEGGTVHFIGLLSNGNVHSHIDHLFAFLDRCAVERAPRVRVHVLTDGRDVAGRSALEYVDALEAKLSECRESGVDCRIASGGGRMLVTMDRYGADWAMVERGWRTHVQGQARGFASAREAIETFYSENRAVTDQYLGAFVIVEEGAPAGTIEDGDGVVFFNFRGDRAIEISMAFEQETFTAFDRGVRPEVLYAGMTQYDGETGTPSRFLVSPPAIGHTLGQYLCAAGVTSFVVSETQKFGHVTYFWNGNNSGYIDERLEKYVEIPSDRVPFDEKPRMKAAEITDAAIGAIEGGLHKFIRLNYANGDMVAHTGVVEAIVAAVEAVDAGLGRLLRAMEAAGGVAVVLADHGNADVMFTEKDGRREPMLAHTLNRVPFIVADYSGANAFRLAETVEGEVRGLSNVAATLLNLLGFEKPEAYAASLVTIGR